MSRGHSGESEHVISISGATKEDEKSGCDTGRDKSTCHCSEKRTKEKKNKKFLLINDRGLKKISFLKTSSKASQSKKRGKFLWSSARSNVPVCDCEAKCKRDMVIQ